MCGILEGEKVTPEDEIIARDVAGAIYLGVSVVTSVATATLTTIILAWNAAGAETVSSIYSHRFHPLVYVDDCLHSDVDSYPTLLPCHAYVSRSPETRPGRVGRSRRTRSPPHPQRPPISNLHRGYGSRMPPVATHSSSRASTYFSDRRRVPGLLNTQRVYRAGELLVRWPENI